MWFSHFSESNASISNKNSKAWTHSKKYFESISKPGVTASCYEYPTEEIEKKINLIMIFKHLKIHMTKTFDM